MKKIWLQGRGAEKSRIEKRGRVAVPNEIRRQGLSAEKSSIKKRGRVAVPNEIQIQERGEQKLKNWIPHRITTAAFRPWF